MVLIIFLFWTGSSGCAVAPFKMWVSVETGYYFFNLLFAYLYYRHLKLTNRENIKYMAFNCFLNVLHSSWLIYGNVIYWKYNDICQNEFDNQMPPNPSNLTWIMLGQIIIGYVTLVKCCTFTTLIICFGPMLWRSIRRARRPDSDWVPTSKQILKKMWKKKFNPQEHDEGEECVICMMEYTEEDTVV